MKTLVKKLFGNKTSKVAVLMAALMVMAVGGASANTGTGATTWQTIITENLTGLAGDVLLVLGSVLVAALGIFALQFAVRKALKFFKSATN